MISCKVKPYSGNDEPYIFVSYAHADREAVYPILEALDARGYRIWYDEGITPGSSWIEEIARKVSDCEMVLFFLSGNFLDSYHCNKELSFSASKSKTFLPVYLEPVVLSPGVEMLITSEQFVRRYVYSDLGQFMEKLCLCRALESCRSVPAAVSGKDPVAVASPGMASAAPGRNGRKTSKAMLRLVMVCCALAFLVLLPYLTNADQAEDSLSLTLTDDLVVSRDVTELGITDVTVTLEMMRKLAALEQLRSLSFQNCFFENEAIALCDLPKELITLFFFECDGIDSVGFLSGLDSLADLTMVSCGITDDILAGGLPQSLESLTLSHNPGITDLSPLAAMQNLAFLYIDDTNVASLEPLPKQVLKVIDFSDTPVSDLSPLVSAGSLWMVYGSDTQVRDITPLADLEGLSSIRFDRCAVQDPEKPFLALRLECLHLADNQLTNLDGFENCTILRSVDLSGNQIRQIDILQKSVGTLEYLDLSGNPLDEQQYLSIRAFKNLEELNLNSIPTEQLVDCSSMKSLKRLSAAGCGLRKIQGLASIIGEQGLEYLCLSNNQIRSILELSISGNVQGMTLDLGGNPHLGLSLLPEGYFEYLVLAENEIAAQTLSKTVEGKTLVISAGIELTERIAQDAFEVYVILDCPLDERVRVEEYFGSDAVTFLDSDAELIEYMDHIGLDYHFLEESTQ